jgi:two-component system, chemotaxis family, protein-glutamate methylesterase/glutaminase
MRGRRIVVIAASAGGVQALQRLMSQLPADLPAALLVVLHVPATGGRVLPRILARAGPLAAAAAIDGEDLLPGRVYAAPPDHHLLVVGDKVRLSQGPRQNGHRPAADPLFASAALTAGPRTIGVVLSGTLDDGAAGSAAVERRGGLVAIQDPQESSYDGMPRAAIAATSRAAVLTVREIAQFIDGRSRIRVPTAQLAPDRELDRYVRLFLDPASPQAGMASARTSAGS